MWIYVFALCRDLRARLEVAIEHVLELVHQVERQKADNDTRTSVSDEVQHSTGLLLVLLLLYLIDLIGPACALFYH